MRFMTVVSSLYQQMEWRDIGWTHSYSQGDRPFLIQHPGDISSRALLRTCYYIIIGTDWKVKQGFKQLLLLLLYNTVHFSINKKVKCK